jgi:hypothetical protein
LEGRVEAPSTGFELCQYDPSMLEKGLGKK